MAVDMFLKIEGENVKGESQDKEFRGDIDVLAWSWGASNSGSTHLGGGGGGGKANFQDISLTKYVDSASEDFLRMLTLGKTSKKMTLTVRRAGGKQLDYMEIVMQNVIISSYSTGGSGGEDRLTENVTLNFSRFTFGYTGQTNKGEAKPTEKFGWDIAENKKL